MRKHPFINIPIIKRATKGCTLVAVSKNQSLQDVEAMATLKIKDFGENKVGELLEKQRHFPGLNWHFIGQLQTNKVKQLIGKCAMIQSVNSLKLAQTIDKYSLQKNLITDCLLQIKFDSNPKRGGVTLEELTTLYEYCKSCKGIRVLGFMVVAPNDLNDGELSKIFRQAYTIFNIYRKSDQEIKYLSMGMSADYLLAVKYGANMVRIGQKMFTKG